VVRTVVRTLQDLDGTIDACKVFETGADARGEIAGAVIGTVVGTRYDGSDRAVIAFKTGLTGASAILRGYPVEKLQRPLLLQLFLQSR